MIFAEKNDHSTMKGADKAPQKLRITRRDCPSNFKVDCSACGPLKAITLIVANTSNYIKLSIYIVTNDIQFRNDFFFCQILKYVI